MKTDEAFRNRQEIIRQKSDIAGSFLNLGKLFHECHQNSYWKLLGHDSFEEFIADPEIAFRRSTAYQYMALYRLFVLELGAGIDRLKAIGPHRLEIVKAALSDGRGEAARSDGRTNTDDLLEKAEHLSLSDLREETKIKVKVTGGAATASPRSLPTPPRPVGLDEYLLNGGCCLCGKPAERSHYPRSRGAGADENHWLPMCRRHHRELHDGGVGTFTKTHNGELWAWAYALIRKLWEEKR